MKTTSKNLAELTVRVQLRGVPLEELKSAGQPLSGNRERACRALGYARRSRPTPSARDRAPLDPRSEAKKSESVAASSQAPCMPRPAPKDRSCRRARAAPPGPHLDREVPAAVVKSSSTAACSWTSPIRPGVLLEFLDPDVAERDRVVVAGKPKNPVVRSLPGCGESP